MEDKRFSHIASDPKFRRIPKAQTKVKIDGRFQSMFTDKKFQVKYTSDKRGRPVNHHSKEDLKRYYEVSSDESSESSDESESKLEGSKLGQVVISKEDSSDSEVEDNDEKRDSQDSLKVKHKSDKKLPDGVKEKIRDLNVDYARGEQKLLSESSSDDEETDEEISESEEIDHRWGELDGDAHQTEEATHRLAACNLDWDRIRAVDLMVLFNSFLPSGGVIHSVVIYPSEFGKQRMKEEEMKGPIELVETKKNELSNNEPEEGSLSNETEGSKYHMERLRQYQLNRLKYYYAVVTFDSPTSADKIYTECDGREYESSATKMDLRFIPDDLTFDDSPKESCLKLPEKYEPRFFTTTALQQAKVELTWDETNPDRVDIAEKITSGKIDNISEKDLQNYLAGSSSEEDVSEHEGAEEKSDSDESQPSNVIDKYKALLLDIQDKEDEKKNKDFEMEISWGINLKEKTDKLAKEKMENSEEKTPFQKYLEKRKEKRKERKTLKKSNQEQDGSDESDIPSGIDMNDPYFAEEFNNAEFKKKTNKKRNKKQELSGDIEDDKQKQAELDLLLMDKEESDQKKHFSLKKIQDKESESKSKKKKKNKKADSAKKEDEDNFQINVEDKRFSALFTSHHFNIDPTDPHYKKTKGTETLIQEKIKRRNEEVTDGKNTKKVKGEKNKNVELNMLVKSVKRKAEAFRNKS